MKNGGKGLAWRAAQDSFPSEALFFTMASLLPESRQAHCLHEQRLQSV